MSTKIKLLAIVGATLLAIGASGAAYAWHGAVHGHGGFGRTGFGLYVGVPLYSSWYYPPTYYAPPYAYYPTAAVSSPVYAEQAGVYQSAPAMQTQQFWYYCNASRAYYPYVQACPGGWQRVAPQPG